MRPRIKWIVMLSLGAAVVFFIPVVVTALFSRGLHGYFYDGYCSCGYAEYAYIHEDGFYSYNPRHKDTRRTYTLRSNGGGWDLVATNGRVAFLLRVQGDEVSISPQFLAKTNWYTMPRVYNIWKVWIPQVLPQ